VVAPIAPPRLDVRPPRVETPVVSRPTPQRPVVVVIDEEEVELVIEPDEQNTGLDATIGDFVLSVSASDTSRTRIAPTERRSLVAPVRGWIDVNATGYAPRSVVGLYLVQQVEARSMPGLLPTLLPRIGFEPFFLGEAVVDENQLVSGEFRIPDWASAGEYGLQINGYTPAGRMKSINLRLDLIDQRADAVSAARACVFPESSVRLTPECRRSLRSLKDLLPAEIDTLKIDITGVAYAQGSKKKNREVALDRATRVRGFLERNGIRGDVSVDAVGRKGLAPGITLGPPPVVVAEDGKPASTVVLTVEWTTEVGPDGVSLR
jgi:outer membrane protein OmpA-like peptidoglycan-associated protein